MEDFKKRLIVEYCQLRDRLNALEKCFNETEVEAFKNRVGEEQFELLEDQRKAMREYHDALLCRIEKLNLMDKIPQYYDVTEHQNREAEAKDLGYDRKISRRDVLSRAYDECMSEMYHKSQPSANYNDLVEKYRTGEIDKDKRIYEEHYLNQKEFEYILDKYVCAYGMRRKWHDYVDCVTEYFNEGATKDKYIKERTDEDGNYHPGYRGYEKLPSFETVVKDILVSNAVDEEKSAEIAHTIDGAVRNRINDCKNFYRFDREEGDFRCAIALGASPTSNPEIVTKYWESQGNPIEIVEHDIDHLWEIDNDYDYSDEED